MFLYFFLFFFFNDTATTEIYTLSLHDALPILPAHSKTETNAGEKTAKKIPYKIAVLKYNKTDSTSHEVSWTKNRLVFDNRSEEHTSELQSQSNLVCRLLLEKKKKKKKKKKNK